MYRKKQAGKQCKRANALYVQVNTSLLKTLNLNG